MTLQKPHCYLRYRKIISALAPFQCQAHSGKAIPFLHFFSHIPQENCMEKTQLLLAVVHQDGEIATNCNICNYF